MKRLFPVSLVLLLITACAPGATPAPTVTAYLSSQMSDSTVTASSITGATMDAANVGDQSGETVGSLLTVPQQNAIPEGQTKTAWQSATGSIKFSTTATGSIVNISAQKLVANALYSVWWIRPGEAQPQDFISVAVPPANTFKTDAQGNGTLQFNVPPDSEYYSYTLAVIYHADNQPITDRMADLGTTTFLHLIGGGPGLSLAPSDATLMATDVSHLTLQPTLQITLSATLEATTAP